MTNNFEIKGKCIILNFIRFHQNKSNVAAPNESTSFRPLCWRILMPVRVQTILNHIRLLFTSVFNSTKEQKAIAWHFDANSDWQRRISQSDCEITKYWSTKFPELLSSEWRKFVDKIPNSTHQTIYWLQPMYYDPKITSLTVHTMTNPN